MQHVPYDPFRHSSNKDYNWSSGGSTSSFSLAQFLRSFFVVLGRILLAPFKAIGWLFKTLFRGLRWASVTLFRTIRWTFLAFFRALRWIVLAPFRALWWLLNILVKGLSWVYAVPLTWVGHQTMALVRQVVMRWRLFGMILANNVFI